MLISNFSLINFSWLLIFFYSDIFFFFLKWITGYSVKFGKLIKKSFNIGEILNYPQLKLYFNASLVYILTLKVDFQLNSTELMFFYFLFFCFFIKNFFNKFTLFCLIHMLYFIFFLKFITNLITLYIILELYTISYMFFFLKNAVISKDVIINLKTNLMLYLWSNFVFTLIFAYGLVQVGEEFGTCDLYELQLCNFFETKNWYLIISCYCKLNFPFFHFLKLEMYKFLELSSLVFFSIFSVLGAWLIISFIIIQPFMLFLFLKYRFINIIIFISINVLFGFFKLNSAENFIAYSGFYTINFILLYFIS